MMIELTNNLFLGKGWHKTAYIDPRDAHRCIKIVHHEHERGEDTDLAREMWYRKCRDKRHLSSTLLTKYYGTVTTNMGTGYVFERVMDYDGKRSYDFKEFLDVQSKNNDIEQAKKIVAEVLLHFQQKFLEEKIITTNMEYNNFLLQKTSAQSFRVRIIDNIGSPVLIPLAFFIDYIALEHCQRYWKRFINNLCQDYPLLVSKEFANELLLPVKI